MIHSVYVDLHIHIGSTEAGRPVKISGSRNLTFYNIAQEASQRKGIEMIGIIDCHSPSVQLEIMDYLHKGEMAEVAGGGIRYQQSTIILGSEIEVRDAGYGPIHVLAYFPNLSAIQQFTQWMSRFMKNVELSSQRIYVTARQLQQEVIDRGGIMIPAHIFTPFKSLFSSGSSQISNLLEPKLLAAVELGLSADTEMASQLSQLDSLPYVTNSDAHSLAKIGREYNQMLMNEPNFNELVLALSSQEGRRISGNYGLNPRLGKYHRTYCKQCNSLLDEAEAVMDYCLYCGSNKMVRGVSDRIRAIADREISQATTFRPPYHYQIPLEFIPDLGSKKLAALLEHFGTEMNVIHRVSQDDLTAVVGEQLAYQIVQARAGSLLIDVGGGGVYGKVQR